MFELAFKSRIPIIGVQTDDLINIAAVLHELTGLNPVEYPSKDYFKFSGKSLYYTDDVEMVSTKLYNKLMENEFQLVVLNVKEANSLIFDAGQLPTPLKLVREYLEPLVAEPLVEPLMQVLKGLSLKSIGEIVMITQARTGGTMPNEIRRTRTMVSGLTQGLYTIDTDLDFYLYPEKLQAWLDLNKSYFLDLKTNPKLVPRGVLMDGSPGVGKTMGAKAVANFFKVPLYRLDMATTLNKYQGESENRVARSLSMVEREAPCVLLIDEVEKLFRGGDDSGTTSRILSQLLWWLGDHQARVLTVMTTNDLSKIPAELYRPGRIDAVIKVSRLVLSEAREFARHVLESMLKETTPVHTYRVDAALKATGQDDFSHAQVTELVYAQIKASKWA